MSASVTPYDDNDWTSVGNVGADDGSNASITAASYDTNDYSYVIRASNYSAGVPAGATIDGIKVEIEGYCDTNELSKDVLVQLSKDNAALVGDNYAKGTDLETSATVRTYGGAADKWGTTWTAAEVNATDFAVHFAYQATQANSDLYVDFVRVTIYYTATESHSGTSTVTGIGAIATGVKKSGVAASTLAGIGAIAGTGRKAAVGAFAVTGVGSTAATGEGETPAIEGTSAITGIGAIATVGAKGAQAPPVIIGIGVTAATGAKVGAVVSQVSGIGAIASDASGARAAEGVLTGVGATDSTASGARAGASVITGIGTTAATGSQGAPAIEGTSSITGVGALASTATTNRAGASVVTGIGGSAYTASAARASASAITGIGAIMGAGIGACTGASTLIGVGATGATGTGGTAPSKEGTSSVIGIGRIAVTYRRPRNIVRLTVAIGGASSALFGRGGAERVRSVKMPGPTVHTKVKKVRAVD